MSGEKNLLIEWICVCVKLINAYLNSVLVSTGRLDANLLGYE